MISSIAAGRDSEIQPAYFAIFMGANSCPPIWGAFFFYLLFKRIKWEGCHGISPPARDPDFSSPHFLHFYSPLIHFDSSPRWVVSHRRTIFGHFLLAASPPLTPPLLAPPPARPSFWQSSSGMGRLSWQLTWRGGHRGRRPVAGTCVGSHRRANTGRHNAHKHTEALGRWAKWLCDSVVSILQK